MLAETVPNGFKRFQNLSVAGIRARETPAWVLRNLASEEKRSRQLSEKSVKELAQWQEELGMWPGLAAHILCHMGHIMLT